MGNAPDGVLFYGYSWPDKEDFDTDLDAQVKALLKQRGHQDLWELHYNGDYEAFKTWRAANSDEYDAWRALIEATKTEIGVDWGTQSSRDYPILYLYVNGTKKSAEWGDAQVVQPADLEVSDEDKAKLDAFLASQGIDPPEGDNQPGWWLTSFYG